LKELEGCVAANEKDLGSIYGFVAFSLKDSVETLKKGVDALEEQLRRFKGK